MILPRRASARAIKSCLVLLTSLGLACSDDGAPRRDGAGDGGGDAGARWPYDPAFRAGFAAVKITPAGMEPFVDWANDGSYDPQAHTRDGVSYPADQWVDSGLDGLLDFQEAGALGPDGKPGKAGVDDDGDKVVDDLLGCHPGDDATAAGAQGCEYLARGSDDRADPAGDNYHATRNPEGKEGDGIWQKVVLAGYGGVLTDDPIRPARAVHDDIWARAMVFSRGEDVFALVVLDLVGYLHMHGNVARRRAAARTGIPEDHIVYMATHSHDGPDVVGIWAGPTGTDYDYVAQVNAAVERAVVKAVAALRPARLKSGAAQLRGCYDAKTLLFKEGPRCNLPVGYDQLKAAPEQYDVPVNQIDLRDPMVFNHAVTALQATDAETGAVLGTVVNFSNHPEVLGGDNNMLSSDFPHYARQALEQRYGGVALYLSATTGSQIGTLRDTGVPLHGPDGEIVPDRSGRKDAKGGAFPAFARNDDDDPRRPLYDKIRSQGYEVADAAAEALAAARETAAPGVAVQTEDLDVPVSNMEMGLGLVMIEGVAKQEGYLTHPDDQVVQADYCPADTGRRACIRVKVCVARVGDVTLLTAPGEVAPEYLLGRAASQVDYGGAWGVYKFAAMPALRDYVQTPQVMMLGIANGYLGYLVPQGDYLSDSGHPNHYEEEGSVGAQFGDTVGNKLLRMLGAPAAVTFNAKLTLHP